MTSYIVEFDDAIHSDPGFRAKDYEKAGVTWGAFVDDTTRVAQVKRGRDRSRVEKMFERDPSVLSWKVDRASNPPMSIYRVVISPNYHAHTVDLAVDDGDRKQAIDDVHAGRDASLFGGFQDPYTFRFPALEEEVSGDADDLDRLVGAAEMLSQSGLSDDQQREIWVAALDEGLKDIEDNVDELIYNAENGDEDEDEDDGSWSRDDYERAYGPHAARARFGDEENPRSHTLHDQLEALDDDERAMLREVVVDFNGVFVCQKRRDRVLLERLQRAGLVRHDAAGDHWQVTPRGQMFAPLLRSPDEDDPWDNPRRRRHIRQQRSAARIAGAGR